MTKTKKTKQASSASKWPIITMLGQKYKIHFGIRAMDRYHDLTDRSCDDLLERLQEDRKSVRIRDLAQWFYTCLWPIGHKGIDYDTFYDAVDEDADLWNTITREVSKQTNGGKQ